MNQPITPFEPNPDQVIKLVGRHYKPLTILAMTPPENGKPGKLAPRVARKTGGRAQVYQLIHTSTQQPSALKVLRVITDADYLANNQPLLHRLAAARGFEACKQIYFTPQDYPLELACYPGLRYGSLMPWVKGELWQDILAAGRSGNPLDPSISWRIAEDFAGAVHFLERHGIAHCDLSSGNVLVRLNEGTCSLIDFDDVYYSGAQHDGEMPGTES